jgi:beta-lactamase regulating signal transducer with metallopeptidase domain
MDKGLWIAFLVFAVFIIYVWGKVRFYIRQSDAQWREVDKSKLRTWEDDEE